MPEGFGTFYFSDGSNFFAVVPGTDQSELKQFHPHEKGSVTPLNPFQIGQEGSADGEPNVTLARLVHFVFQHHIYVAVDEDIIILNLNHTNPVYEHIPIGHIPLQVWVFEVSRNLYLYVLYEENQRGRLATFRKYDNHVWGRYGPDGLLLYSPQWYDLEKITKPIIFKASDLVDPSHDSTYAAVASGWNININTLSSRTYLMIEVPIPCDNITRLVYNHHRHDMLVECHETTMYFHYESDEFIREDLWEKKIGNSSFSPHDGRYASIISNASDISIITVIQLFDTKPHYKYFHLASSIGRVAVAQFVTISRTKHYLCYTEYSVPGVKCVDVEKAILNPDIPGVGLVRLQDTEAVWNQDTDTLTMYSHQNILVLSGESCVTDPCQNLLMTFDMTSLKNIWNVTGIKPEFMAWRPDPLVSNRATQAPSEATQPSAFNVTEEPTEPETIPTSEPTQPKTIPTSEPTQPESFPTLEIPSSVPTEEPKTDSVPLSEKPTKPDFVPSPENPSKPDAIPKPTPEDPTLLTGTTNSIPSPNSLASSPESCGAQLSKAASNYERLLWITITICTCFCIAMVIVITLMALMICLTRSSLLRHHRGDERHHHPEQEVELTKKS